ncbi:MAG: hypothetical protein IJ243_10890 [Prevotella sp.]|nr:hypothetical protein [Prevotella sp.]
MSAGDQYVYEEIIKTLNQNINYVRIHAMSKSPAGGEQPEDGDTPAPEDGGSGEVTPVTPE